MLRRALAAAQESHRSGRLYLYCMGASAVGAGLLYAEQERELRMRRQLHQEFDVMLGKARVQAQAELESEHSRLKEMPSLWTGVLTSADHRLQGHKMLRGCRVGQTVDVLEEGVGADARYLTVVDRSSGASGMYPSDWVEKQAP